jgi:hypothetical protein
MIKIFFFFLTLSIKKILNLVSLNTKNGKMAHLIERYSTKCMKYIVYVYNFCACVFLYLKFLGVDF